MHPPVREFGVSGRLLVISALRRLLRAPQAATQPRRRAAKCAYRGQSLPKGSVVHHSKIDPLMSLVGQERRIGAVRNISALPKRADVGADIVEPPVSARRGCEQMQQSNLFIRSPHRRGRSAVLQGQVL
jgi:hypothetical protein